MKAEAFHLLIKSFLSTFIISGIIFSLFIAVFIKKELGMKGNIYPNIYVDNINFGNQKISRLQEHFENENKKLNDTEILLTYKEDEIATFSGATINLGYDIEAIVIQASSIGRSGSFLTQINQKISSIFDLSSTRLSSEITYNTIAIDEYLDYLKQKYNKDPQNALFEVNNGKVTAFQIETGGKSIDTTETIDAIQKHLKKPPGSEKKIEIRIADIEIEPEITLNSINNFGIVEKIGEGISNFSGSSSERIHNVILGANKINGTLVPKDEIFSFNKTVGDISANTGFKPAYVIKNGRTELGDGGGICQDSTTMFRAALDAGLPILERTDHAYRVRYYEQDRKPGFDATVFAPSVDFKFKNDTPAHILIQTEVNQKESEVTFTLYGKKDSRRVEISEAAVWDVKPPPDPLYQDDPTLKRGQQKQVDWAAFGANAKFHYRVVREAEVLIDRDFLSTYRPWQAVYLVGIAD